MQFLYNFLLNPAALAGLVMVGVPVIIHLLNKRRFKQVRWGAMMFLRASLTRVSRRIRMENFLLMLLRILIVVLVVMAFARPFLKTKFTVWGAIGQQKTAMIILIDRSMSMEYKHGGKTNLELAKDAAKTLISSLNKGDTVSIFGIGSKTEPLIENPALDFTRAKDGVDAMTTVFESADFMNAVDNAVRHMAKLKNPAKEVFIITDLQQIGWNLDRINQWIAITDPLRNTNTFKLKPPFKVVDISGGETENVAVTNVEHFPRIIGPNREVKIEFEIKNYGKTSREIVVTPSVDGVQRPNLSKLVKVEPDRAATDNFVVKFDAPGSHVVTVETGEDNLLLDNKRYHVLDVIKEVPVLVVNGAPSVQPFKGETDFLRAALSPRLGTAIGGDSMALAQPKEISVAELAGENFANFPVIILANVSQLDAGDWDRLKKWVTDGGGLLIFPGDLVDANNYNNNFSDEGLMPAAIAEMQGDEKDKTNSVAIDGPPYQHKLMDVFRDATRADLTVGKIRKWFKLDPPPPGKGSNVIVSLRNGLPFLVEKTVGSGRVVVCATRCNAEWSDLPVRRFYVPLMHELVYYLASGNQNEHNLELGQPMLQTVYSDTLKPESGLLRLPPDPKDPDKERTQPLKFDKVGTAWIGRAESPDPGLYQIEVDTGEGKKSWYFAKNYPIGEFELIQLAEKLQKEELRKALGEKDEVVIQPKDLKDIQPSRFGIEIWRQIAFILLALLFVELLMTSRRTKKQEVQHVEVPEAVLNK